jgi:hypothetical protein
MAAFLQKYPKASVWIAPGQYGPYGSCGGVTMTKLDDDDNNNNDDDNEPCNMGYRVDGILYDPPTTSLLPVSSSSSSLQPQPQPQQPQSPWMDEFDYTTLYVNLPKSAGPVSEVAFVHRPTKILIVTDAVVYIPDRAPSILETYFDPDVVQNDVTFWPKTVLQAVFLPLRVVEEEKEEDDTTTTTEHQRQYFPGYDAIANRF